MKTKKIPAFTLSELLVVLIVASIVIAMGFLVLTMVRKQVASIQENYQKKQEVQLFETTFYRDFNTHNAVFKAKENTLMLINTKDSIQYVFSDNFIIREKDSFQIQVVTKKLFLEGVPVQEHYIDAMSIGLSSNFANKKLFVFQTKDASFYLNN